MSTTETASAPVARKSNKPRTSHVCPECGEKFVGVQDALFCTVKHQQAFHNRNAKRGKVALPLLLTWRNGKNKAHRESGAWAFNELCALADEWNREDRVAGRQPAWDYLKAKRVSGWKACDHIAG